MSATILQFTRPSQTHARPRARGKSVLSELPDYVKEFSAVLRSFDPLKDDFDTAIWKARRAILLEQQRERRVAAFFAMAAGQIQYRLRNEPQIEYHRALVRARRVIEGDGTIGAAICRALGDHGMGGAA